MRKLILAAALAVLTALPINAEKVYEYVVFRLSDTKTIKDTLEMMSKAGYEVEQMTASGSYVMVLLSKVETSEGESDGLED